MSLTGFFYTQAGLCVFVSACPPPPSELWFSAKDETRDLTSSHFSVCLYVFPFWGPLPLIWNQRDWSLNCTKFLFPHTHSLHSNITAANQLAAGLQLSPGQAFSKPAKPPPPRSVSECVRARSFICVSVLALKMGLDSLRCWVQTEGSVSPEKLLALH